MNLKFGRHTSIMSEVSTGSDVCPLSPDTVISRQSKRTITTQSGMSMDSRLSRASTVSFSLRSFSVASNLERTGGLLDYYDLVKVIGQGAFGKVNLATSKKSGEEWAVKTISRCADPNEDAIFQQELQVSKLMKHPYVMYLHEVYHDEDAHHLVMQLYTGGELNDYLISHPYEDFGFGLQSYGLATEDVGKYMWQMLSGLRYIHHHGIAHRDVKAENYMFEKPGLTNLRLVDFGLARKFKEGKRGTPQPMQSKVGSMYAMAPEVARHEAYTEKCDIWGVGVVGFMMCCGQEPFQVERQSNDDLKEVLLEQLIMSGPQPTFVPVQWNRHCKQAKELISQLLAVDQEQRPSAKDFLTSKESTGDWLRRNGTGEGQACCCSIS